MISALCREEKKKKPFLTTDLSLNNLYEKHTAINFFSSGLWSRYVDMGSQIFWYSLSKAYLLEILLVRTVGGKYSQFCFSINVICVLERGFSFLEILNILIFHVWQAWLCLSSLCVLLFLTVSACPLHLPLWDFFFFQLELSFNIICGNS